MFAEFGWNYSRQLNIAQCRGAANMHGKDWGSIITWTYDQSPYLEPGEEYEDLVLAYENGAKCIILFDSNGGWTRGVLTHGVLKQEHLEALKQFWGMRKRIPERVSRLKIGLRTSCQKITAMVSEDRTTRFGGSGKLTTSQAKSALTSATCLQSMVRDLT